MVCTLNARLNYQLSGKDERRTHTIDVMLHNSGDYVKLFTQQ